MLPPVHFDQGASWAILDPVKSTSIVIASSSGFIDVLDTNEDENARVDSDENSVQVSRIAKYLAGFKTSQINSNLGSITVNS